MIRVVVFILIIVIGVYVSIYIDRQYRCRLRVYKDMKYILSVYKEEIMFTKEGFSKVLSIARPKITDYTYMLIYEYMESGGIRYIFKSADFADVYTFLDEVGQGNVEYEVSRVKYYIGSIDDGISALSVDYEKNGKVYVKLILVMGVLIAMLLL